MKSTLVCVVATLMAGTCAHAQDFQVKSPNGQLSIKLKNTNNGWQIVEGFKGETILVDKIGLTLADGSTIATKSKVTASQKKSVNQKNSFVLGKTRFANNKYNELRVNLVDSGKNGEIKSVLYLRAYDNGLAFRVQLPKQAALNNFEIIGEGTQLRFDKNYKCWGLKQDKFQNSHEGEYNKLDSDSLRSENLFDYPLVCKTGKDNKTFAINEVDVNDYPASFVSGRGDGLQGVSFSLAPRLDNEPNKTYGKVLAKYSDSFEVNTPWRVIAVGDSPTNLVESNIFQNLATPNVIGDTSWIKPGKSAWDWWNGWDVNVENAGVNTATYKKFIDFAHEFGLEYVLIDEGWYEGSSTVPNPKADVVKPIQSLNMAEIISYAKSKNVDVMVWLQWSHLDAKLDVALKTYEDWGIKGIKVDFMDRSDQQMVEFYHELLSKSAKHKLLVDLHGAYIPNGLNITYPNFITQEGVMGAEYNKWSDRVTATHNVTLPFTRMIAGPIDYTPGGFRNTTPNEFNNKRSFTKPWVQTTRGQALAMYVVFDSPLQMVSDSPGAYKLPDGSLQDGAEFLKEVPATWDETKVLSGDIGEYIVTARRKGGNWFIGAMTNESGRVLPVDWKFLPKGKYRATIYQDGKDTMSLVTTNAEITSLMKTQLRLAPSGGAVVKLELIKK